ncbi:hypothetical protein GCK72_024941 [Caenorhabditis remanei]|uniref:Uncharacterized protein n=2 Tax=Caenorhabditis remanei TaxID=31234 RepID=E3MVL7_CAERE|nr:hypothetical protein GCK72_024941 [Caenorhabditis remanei]EFP10205.1 hypothetical protein CRE_24106 [Caenorhabditis remanei]KAF1748474.1 hypothetical protein GCK72_024941 [Caenorhabditis remanei]
MEQFKVELDIDPEPQSRHVMTKRNTRLANARERAMMRQDVAPTNGKRTRRETRKNTVTVRKKNNPVRQYYPAFEYQEDEESSPEPVVKLTPERRAAAEQRIAQQKAEIEEQKRNGTYVDPMELYEEALRRNNQDIKPNKRGSEVPFPENPFRAIVLARIEKERVERQRRAAEEVGDLEAQAATYAETRKKLDEARLYMRRYAVEEAAKRGLPPPPEDPLDIFDLREHFDPDRADAPPGPSYEEIMARVTRPKVISQMLEEAAKKEEAERLAREAEAAAEVVAESTSNNQVKSCTKRKRAHKAAEVQELNGHC